MLENPLHFRGTFNYTASLVKVCEDVCFRVPSLSHIDISQVAVSFSQTKHAEPYGTFASITPLRFQNGMQVIDRRGRQWTLQRCFHPDGREYLYILYFYVPRFIELKLSQKLETIIHELYHISPEFNGDLRRFPGRCFAHGASQKKYDETVRKMTDYWLKQNPPSETWDFLRYNYRELEMIKGKPFGSRIAMPKMIPFCSLKQH